MIRTAGVFIKSLPMPVMMIMSYSPTEDDRHELKKNKLPDLDSPLTAKLALHPCIAYSRLLIFTKFQEGVDERIANRIRSFFKPQREFVLYRARIYATWINKE